MISDLETDDVLKNVKLEYIWLDGDEDEPTLRSKTKVMNFKTTIGDYLIDYPNSLLKQVPEWSFDGSSTMQAHGDKSDCILKPVKIIKDTARHDPAFLVMC